MKTNNKSISKDMKKLYMLVGIQNDVAAMKNSMTALQKIKHRSTI